MTWRESLENKLQSLYRTRDSEWSPVLGGIVLGLCTYNSMDALLSHAMITAEAYHHYLAQHPGKTVQVYQMAREAVGEASNFLIQGYFYAALAGAIMATMVSKKD